MQETITEVFNKVFQGFNYKRDIDNHGVVEHWGDCLDKLDGQWEGDCDDFAIALMGSFHIQKNWAGLAFGIFIIADPPHAVNIFIDSRLDVYLVEPQTDRIFKMPDDWIGNLIIM